MISILLPAFQSYELIRDVFLPSLRSGDPSITKELVIFDNGDKNRIEWFGLLSQMKHHFLMECKNVDIEIIGNGKNVGLNAALNACARFAKHDLFFLPHTDMFLMPGWDRALVDAQKFLAPSKFLLCSRSIEPVKGHTPFHLIRDFGNEPGNFRKDELLASFIGHEDRSIVTGYRMPFFLHRDLWNKMNGVDENYFSYATDDDLFMSAYAAGVRSFWMVNGSLVYHLQGKSNKQQKVDKDSQAPYVYFAQKWAAKGYDTSRSIDSLVQSLIPWNLKVR